jgi:excisionase family DNA binding protein
VSEPSPFLTVAEVAALLRVPRSRVYTWTRARAVPCYRAGRRFTFDAAEVLAWFRQTQRVDGQTAATTRSRRLLATSRRGAPNGLRGGQRARYAGRTRGSNGEAAAVAISLPHEGQGGVRDGT